jgi:anti-sigma factor ChrR (cupin superfamily)
MKWTPSPSASVWRKRVHRVGPAESGQVTSVVRYARNARFPPHEHPQGEEILVLEGVFSDEAGDWEAGSYLLNPEGFRHAPFSREGCVIFVKLRQAPGRDRQHIQLQTRSLDWEPGALPGVQQKNLYRQDGFADRMRLEAWDKGISSLTLEWPEGAELFVVRGEFQDERGSYGEGTWLRQPAGSRQKVSSTEGCELYIKEGGFAYLLGV